MRTILLYSILYSLIGSDLSYAQNAQNRQIEAQQIAIWENNLEEAKKEAPELRMSRLWLGLRNIGYRRSFPSHSMEIESLFFKIQSEILSIPNHAQYFADEIERIRKTKERVPRANQTDYDRTREWYLRETLNKLPSPETIRVLGHYLYDERDTPPEPLFMHENSFLATLSLSEIGLRNFPCTSFQILSARDWRETQKITQVWYEKVKSGTLPFSFIGQTVEYRFKPDGTVESTPLPVSVLEQDPKPPAPAPAAPVTRPQDDVTDTRKSSPDASVWSLIAGGILALAAVFYWLRSRRTASPE